MQCCVCGVKPAVHKGQCLGCWQIHITTCGGCGKVSDDVQERHSYGVYAGRFCTACARDRFRDGCGLSPSGQGRAEDLDEFMAGGYPAIDGEGDEP